MNKAKREALELLNKFNLDEYLYHALSFHQAKKCALIAIDELLLHERTFHSELDKTTDYLEEVKKELEKL